MALDTSRNEEIFIEGITGYGFHRVHNLSKQILVGIIRRFFNKKSTAYKLALNDLNQYQNVADSTPATPNPADMSKVLYIEQEFPYFERRIPGIIVSLDNVTELKLYNGTDNQISISKSDNTIISMYFGAATIPITLTILAESPDMRMDISNLLYMCFSHYHRWQYVFKGDDDSIFSIIPAQSTITFGTNFEVKEGDQRYIYGTTVSFTGYCDFNFCDNLTTSTQYWLANNFEINPLSGPVS
jgi:hypothetical protein